MGPTKKRKCDKADESKEQATSESQSADVSKVQSSPVLPQQQQLVLPPQQLALPPLQLVPLPHQQFVPPINSFFNVNPQQQVLEYLRQQQHERSQQPPPNAGQIPINIENITQQSPSQLPQPNPHQPPDPNQNLQASTSRSTPSPDLSAPKAKRTRFDDNQSGQHQPALEQPAQQPPAAHQPGAQQLVPQQLATPQHQYIFLFNARAFLSQLDNQPYENQIDQGSLVFFGQRSIEAQNQVNIQIQRDAAVLEQIHSFARPHIFNLRWRSRIDPPSLVDREPLPQDRDPGYLRIVDIVSRPVAVHELGDKTRCPVTLETIDDQLILLEPFFLNFENRWYGTEVPVDYAAIRFKMLDEYVFMRDLRLKAILRPELRLAKFKSYGVRHTTELLPALSVYSDSLIELNIEHMEITSSALLFVTFNELILLSIDLSIRGNFPRRNDQKFVVMEAPKLKYLFLAWETIDYIAFGPETQLTSLHTDRLPDEAELITPTFASLIMLECNRVENTSEQCGGQPDQIQLIFDILSDEFLPNLKSFFMNLRNLSSASKMPMPEDVEILGMIFDEIKDMAERSDLRRDTQIFFNHIHLNPVVEQRPQRLEFADFRFDQPLVVSHYHNYLNNRLSLVTCQTVDEVDYLDTLYTFSLLEPFQNQEPAISTQNFGFDCFMRLFPNIRKVRVAPPTRTQLSASLLLRFLNGCRALTHLELHKTGLGESDFYRHLNQINSLRTLHHLHVFEWPHRLNVSLIRSLGLLGSLATNLATDLDLVQTQLIDEMRTGAEFHFQFWPPEETMERFVVPAIILNKISFTEISAFFEWIDPFTRAHRTVDRHTGSLASVKNFIWNLPQNVD